MEEQIRCDSLQVIKDVIKNLKNEDFIAIEEVSDHIIHCASVYQDSSAISLSVSVFALAKMVQRKKKILPHIYEILENAKNALLEKNDPAYLQALKKLIATISQEDHKVQKYIRRVMNDAQIKKGFKLYEHGLSLGKTAELLGISHWELMKYIGNVKLPEITVEKISLPLRLKYVRTLFNVR